MDRSREIAQFERYTHNTFSPAQCDGEGEFEKKFFFSDHHKKPLLYAVVFCFYELYM